MAEALIPVAEIAQFIIDLQRDVRSLKQKLRLRDKEFDLGSSEEPQDVGGQLPSTAADYKTPVTVVTSIIDEVTILVKRQIPDASAAGWADDPVLISQLEVTLPDGTSSPEVGRIVQPVYTGLFQINTLGTTVSLPRYGLFGVGGGAQPFRVVSDENDHLTAVTASGTTIGTVVFNIAKAHNLQRSPWDGNTVEGLAYNYSSPRERIVTRISDSEQSSQIIIPTYIPSFTIVMAIGASGLGVLVNSIAVTLLDINADARMWSEIASS